eukprot:7147327-Alexandrium_andersonii.AAC.1
MGLRVVAHPPQASSPWWRSIFLSSGGPRSEPWPGRAAWARGPLTGGHQHGLVPSGTAHSRPLSVRAMPACV